MQRINAGEPIQTLISDLHNLKEAHREICRLVKLTNKVKNILDMRPCFIDYAVNFGIVNTENQWRENLLNNDNLAAPILMSTDTDANRQ